LALVEVHARCSPDKFGPEPYNDKDFEPLPCRLLSRWGRSSSVEMVGSATADDVDGVVRQSGETRMDPGPGYHRVDPVDPLPVILVSFGFVVAQAIRRIPPWKVALPFAVNLVANLLFMATFFGMRNVPLAADILIVWTTILWMTVAVWPHHRWVVVAQGA
jgi:hypothetical protein